MVLAQNAQSEKESLIGIMGAIREGIIYRNHGRTNWCSGAGARWLLDRAQRSPSCMPMRAARYDVAGRVASSPGRGVALAARHGCA